MSEAMSVEIFDNGYEEWIEGNDDADPFTLREVVFELPAAPEGAGLDDKLTDAADHYIALRTCWEVTRFFEDEEADEYGPAHRVLRLIVE